MDEAKQDARLVSSVSSHRGEVPPPPPVQSPRDSSVPCHVLPLKEVAAKDHAEYRGHNDLSPLDVEQKPRGLMGK